jgi:hypothetical protein
LIYSFDLTLEVFKHFSYKRESRTWLGVCNIGVIIERLESQETEESRRLGPLNLVARRRIYIYIITIKLSKNHNN